MAEYINREEFRAAMQHIYNDPTCPMHIAAEAEIEQIIDCAPTVDVVPVVHSYWEGYSCSQYMGTDEWGEPKWRDGRFYVCHNNKCRRKTVIKSNYCPNCGAKMDGEAE